MNMYEICDITENDLRNLFAELKTREAVAKRLGVSKETVGKYGRSLGLTIPAHRPKQEGRPSMRSGYGKIVSYLRNNPGAKIPSNGRKAAELIGVSQDNIYSYVKYRKKAFERYFGKMQPLWKLDKTVEDIQGRKIVLERVRAFDFEFDVRRMSVRIHLVLGEAFRTMAVMSISELEALYTVVNTVHGDA